jgi:hypothetical protein
MADRAPVEVDEEVMQHYEYWPLAFRHIRLMRIHRDYSCYPKGPSPNQLHIDLEDHRLDEAEFAALSYTWDPATMEEEEYDASQIFTKVQRCYPVMCDGQIILATKSLRHALRQLRILENPAAAELFYKTTGKRKLFYLWADGICNNQDDLAERAAQVPLMAELYAKANIVHAYLGEKDEYAASALETSVVLAGLMNPVRYSGAAIIPVHALEDEKVFAKVGSKPPTPDQWWAWCIFLPRPWFSRTWILQEAALAGPRRAVLHCGQLVTALETVLAGLALVQTSRWNVELLEWMRKSINLPYDEYNGIVLAWLLSYHPYCAISTC